MIAPGPRLLTLSLSSPQGGFSIFSTAITLLTALMNWSPVFHLQWLVHIPHGRHPFAHNCCVELSNARINRFSDGFFPSTSRLWNSLPSNVFPASFHFPSFKRQVYHHLRDQMAFIYLFIFFFLAFLDILFIFFILSVAFLFLFLRDAILRRAHVPVLCSLS